MLSSTSQPSSWATRATWPSSTYGQLQASRNYHAGQRTHGKIRPVTWRSNRAARGGVISGSRPDAVRRPHEGGWTHIIVVGSRCQRSGEGHAGQYCLSGRHCGFGGTKKQDAVKQRGITVAESRRETSKNPYEQGLYYRKATSYTRHRQVPDPSSYRVTPNITSKPEASERPRQEASEAAQCHVLP